MLILYLGRSNPEQESSSGIPDSGQQFSPKRSKAIRTKQTVRNQETDSLHLLHSTNKRRLIAID
nr:hypothetical protein Itr_chr09CG06330 [Ipomoea trifida]